MVFMWYNDIVNIENSSKHMRKGFTLMLKKVLKKQIKKRYKNVINGIR